MDDDRFAKIAKMGNQTLLEHQNVGAKVEHQHSHRKTGALDKLQDMIL